jgi:hypothetical protein
VQVTLLSYDHANTNLALRTFKEITNAGADSAVIVNNALHSIFSNCEVSLQGEIIGTSNNHYGHKALIETELSHPTECKDTWLACQGYDYEVNPGDAADNSITTRQAKNIVGNWNNFTGVWPWISLTLKNI